MPATIIICAILTVILGAIVWNLIKSKKQGKSSCGCDCASCGGICHKLQEELRAAKTHD